MGDDVAAMIYGLLSDGVVEIRDQRGFDSEQRYVVAAMCQCRDDSDVRTLFMATGPTIQDAIRMATERKHALNSLTAIEVLSRYGTNLI